MTAAALKNVQEVAGLSECRCCCCYCELEMAAIGGREEATNQRINGFF